MTRIDPAEFPVWSEDTVRYGDTDRQGHVNNAVFATFFETGRVAVIYNPTQPLSPAGHSFVIAKLVIDFLAELHWPGRIRIGTAVASLGRSSIVLRQVLVQDDQPRATSESVIVLVNDATHTSAALPDAARAILERLIAAAP